MSRELSMGITPISGFKGKRIDGYDILFPSSKKKRKGYVLRVNNKPYVYHTNKNVLSSIFIELRKRGYEKKDLTIERCLIPKTALTVKPVG